MTKAELIRKISKNAGVVDGDAKIFFELFLRKISAKLPTGQSVLINDFGYFHRIKGTIKKPAFSFADTEISEEEIDLILYSVDKDLRKSDIKGLVFNIPVSEEEDYHPIDSSFSLSIGKPLIPLRGVPFDDIYIPTSGYEYRRLIESKVDKLTEDTVVSQSDYKFPMLIIDARSYNSNQVQFEWDKKIEDDSVKQTSDDIVLDDYSSREKSDYEKQSEQLKNIVWDFGENLTQQIEEESILDVALEKIGITEEKQQEFEEFQKKDNTDEKPSPELYSNPPEEKEIKNDAEVYIDKNESLLTENPETIVNGNNYDSIEGMETEANVPEIRFEMNDDKTLAGADALPVTDETEIPSEDINDAQFWHQTSKYFQEYKPGNIKNKTDESIDSDKLIKELIESDTNMNTVFVEENQIETEAVSYNEVQQNFESQLNESEQIVKTDIGDSEIINNANDKQVEFYKAEKKNSLVPFIIFPLIIVIISAVLYWYLEYYSKEDLPVTKKNVVLNQSNAKIIVRNFDIPISYPYLPQVLENKNQEPVLLEESPKQPNTISSDKLVSDEKNKIPTKDVVAPVHKTEIKKDNEIAAPPTGKSLNVGNNIFKYGDVFIIQVASFRASSIAENEAGKYRNQGLNAFVETAEIPGRGTWYRVRIGNFTSKEMALNFIQKNKR